MGNDCSGEVILESVYQKISNKHHSQGIPLVPPKCRVLACLKRHSRHQCRICGSKDSEHLTSECPAGQDLFHLTSTDKVAQILGQGFISSARGRLGEGSYFYKDKETAQNIGKQMRDSEYQNGFSIIKCRVFTGRKMKYENQRSDYDGQWRQGYDSVEGIHPSWAGNEGQFPEICVSDSRRIFIYGLEAMSGSIIVSSNQE